MATLPCTVTPLDEGAYTSTRSTFECLRSAIDELDGWPMVTIPNTTEDVSGEPHSESEPSSSEPTTPDSEDLKLATEVRALKDDCVDAMLQEMYRDIEEAAGSWNNIAPHESDEEDHSESVMDGLLREVGEAVLEWAHEGSWVGAASESHGSEPDE